MPYDELSLGGYLGDETEPTQRHRLQNAGIDADCTPVDTFIERGFGFATMEDE